jgi:ribonuclease-3
MCKKLRLDQCLILGTHEEVSGGRAKPSLLADAFEAFIGALFVDAGYEICEEKILAVFSSHLKRPLKKLLETDYKSRLQEKIQSLYKELPTYKLVSQVGPDHQKQFEVEVKFRKQTLGIGSGESKKMASQQAARNALRLLDQPDFKFPDLEQETPL